jgi:CRP-like cAMP-binding protein
METLQPILSRHPFFRGLDKPYLELLTGCASNERFKAGTYLFRENEEAAKFFIVRQGLVAIEVGMPGGEPKTLYTHGEGDVIGWSWLFPPYHWHFSGRALQPTRVIALDGTCLRGKCERDHTLGYEFMKRFSDKMMRCLDATRLQLLDMFGHN